MSKSEVITIDGPTASGKGTIARRVADQLSFHYLDSGALYRAVAWQALQDAVDDGDETKLAALAAQLNPRFAGGNILIGGRDITDAIRAEEVSQLASRIAVHGSVRQALLDLQRSRSAPPGLVADGRDMGTVVFPDARLKIFLSASLPARAERRHKQLMEQAFPANITALSRDVVEQEIQSRDRRDEGRAAAPLKPAVDAYLIDSSELTPDEVVAVVLNLWR